MLCVNLAAKRVVHRFGATSVDAILPADHVRLTADCLKTRRSITAPAFCNGHGLHWNYRCLPRRELVFAVGYPLRESVMESMMAARSLKAVLGQFAFGVLVMDATFTIRYANPRAKTLLENIRPGQIRNGRLCQSMTLFWYKLESLMKSDEGSALLPRGPGQAPLEILVKRLPGFGAGPAESLALICLVDPDYVPPSFPERLQRLYRLTPAEARVAAVLRCGARLEDGAVEMSVSRNTIRTHVRKLCQKTGQLRLAELLWRLNVCVAAIITDLIQ